jgi:FAD/FMN-containing dehydrogenase
MSWFNESSPPAADAALPAGAAERAERHARKVARVAEQLRRHRGDRPLSLKKSAVSHQVPKRGDLRLRDDKVDVSDLDELLSIDPDARVCVAEPGITFVDLVRATMRHGQVPIVVPELETITIGGAVAGCSLESMSFKHGGFHDTCLAYEVITAAGDVLACTADNEHALVFQMIHGSFGTLGILSKLTFRLVPAKAFVRVDYETHATLAAYRAAIERRYASGDVDFMDGIIHSPTKYVLCLGHFVDRAPYASRYDWVTPYFETTARRRNDYFKTSDYLFRYDRGVTNPTPRSAVGRLLVGKFLSSANLLRLAEKLNRFLPAERPGVTLDLFLPISRMEDFLAWHTATLGHYPLWCVPYKRVRDYEWIAPGFYESTRDELFVDLAIYGMAQPVGRNIYRELEEALPRFNAIKTLISFNYYSEEEFWAVFHRPNYDAVKRVTDPHNRFRDLYTKTCRASQGLT